MIDHTTLLILGGCLLGAVQLLAGIGLGMWLRRCDVADARRGRHDMMQANLIARRLKSLADQMSSSANEHRSQLARASAMLTSESGRPDDGLAELVVDVIDDMVRANHNLHSQLETAESRLKEQALQIETHISRSLTDPLTGLPNRRAFNDRLEERMAGWNRRRETFALLLLDVDHFKKLNDELGHLAGDEVLVAVGRAVRAAVRREDAVARFGGEEFAILLPNTSLDHALHVAEKVRRAVAHASAEYNGRPVRVTVSGGLAAIDDRDKSDAALIERADAALYAAKGAGRNRTWLHDGSQCVAADAPADPLVQLIHRAPDPASEASFGEAAGDFASYLPPEAISPQLAQVCDELRRHVEQHGNPAHEPTAAAR